MKYVIMKDSDNMQRVSFVSREGEHSYTSKLQEARTFQTREAAQAECCGNERARSLDEAMGEA